MSELLPCLTCGKVHACAICGLGPAWGGFHVCYRCISRMQEMYAQAERRAKEVGWDAMMREQRHSLGY